MCQNKALWASYQTISFKAKQRPVYDSFSILTAFNPRSIEISHTANLERNKLLAQEIQQAGWRYMDLTGGAVDGSWREPGFAVELSLEQAVKLAARWEQNAIYWVENNQLYLVPVLIEGFEQQRLGEFLPLFYTE